MCKGHARKSRSHAFWGSTCTISLATASYLTFPIAPLRAIPAMSAGRNASTAFSFRIHQQPNCRAYWAYQDRAICENSRRTLKAVTIAPSANPPAARLPLTATAAREVQASENTRVNVEILALTDTWVAVNKPAGILVHRTKLYHSKPGERYLVDEVKRELKHRFGYARKVLPVHRLDRPTSGVLLFSLDSPQHATALHASLQAHLSCKQYWVLTFGADMPEKWDNNFPLRDLTGKDRKQRKASSSFEQLLRLDEADMSIVRAQISTGRRHQIRRHLSYSRHPVVGDTSYAKGVLNRTAREKYGATRCCLHARRISFKDPQTSEEVLVDSPVPHDLRQVLSRIQGYDEQLHRSLIDLGGPVE